MMALRWQAWEAMDFAALHPSTGSSVRCFFVGAGHARDRHGVINRAAAPIRKRRGRGHGPLLPAGVLHQPAIE